MMLRLQFCLICVLCVPARAQFSNNIVTDLGADPTGVADCASAINTWKANAAAYNTSHPGAQVILGFPAQPSLFKINSSGNFTDGITNFLWTSVGGASTRYNGALIFCTNGALQFGAKGLWNDNLHDGRIQSVSAGATSVTLSNAALYTLFTTNGNLAMISGVDCQGFGYPPGPVIFQYVHITGATSGGVISFAEPLQSSYEAGWPNFYAGDASHIDAGGPATIYALPPNFNTWGTFQNMTISNGTQSYCDGYGPITFANGSFAGGNGVIASQNNQMIRLNWDKGPGYSEELDKCEGSLTESNCYGVGIITQSQSVNNMTLVGCIYTNNVGVTGNVFITNCSISNLTVGASSYGGGGVTLYASNDVFSNIVMETGVTGATAFITNNGVLVSPIASGAITWAVPYQRITFNGPSGKWFYPGQILDITNDGINAYIVTTLPGGYFFPGQPEGFAGTNVTFQSCTGCPAALSLSLAPASNIFGSYTSYTYTTNFNGSAPSVFSLGKIKYISVNVTTAYTGAQGTLDFQPFAQFGAQFLRQNFTYVPKYNPIIDANQTGLRTIWNGDYVQGAQSGDSGLNTGGYIWATPLGAPAGFAAYGNHNISAESSAVWPAITVIIATDPTEANFPIFTSPPFGPGRNF